LCQRFTEWLHGYVQGWPWKYWAGQAESLPWWSSRLGDQHWIQPRNP
jgi:hypothetical protein